MQVFPTRFTESLKPIKWLVLERSRLSKPRPDISGEFLTGGFEGGNTGAFSVTEYRGQPLAVADQGSFQVLKRHKFSASGFKAIFSKSETNQNASLRLLAIVKI